MAGLRRQVAVARLVEFLGRVEQEEPGTGAPADDVRDVVPLDALPRWPRQCADALGRASRGVAVFRVARGVCRLDECVADAGEAGVEAGLLLAVDRRDEVIGAEPRALEILLLPGRAMQFQHEEHDARRATVERRADALRIARIRRPGDAVLGRDRGCVDPAGDVECGVEKRPRRRRLLSVRGDGDGDDGESERNPADHTNQHIRIRSSLSAVRGPQSAPSRLRSGLRRGE
jgi:hypothetical protein